VGRGHLGVGIGNGNQRALQQLFHIVTRALHYPAPKDPGNLVFSGINDSPIFLGRGQISSSANRFNTLAMMLVQGGG
jgi:hypothetical protein